MAKVTSKRRKLDVMARLRMFDKATERQRPRERSAKIPHGTDRGWTREELYERSRPR